MSKIRWISLLLIALLAIPVFATGVAADEAPVQMNYWMPRTIDKQASGEQYDAFHDFILDNTGVDIVVSYYDWGDTYNQKMNMYAAAQDLPSGVWLFGEPVKNPFTLSSLNFMGESGMFHDWMPFVDDTDTYATLKENASETFITMTKNKQDGALYIYPCNIHYAFPHAPGGWTIRKDWMEQVGASYPTNEEELYELIKTFKANIQDINGNPVIPFALCGFDEPVQEYVLRFVLNSWMGSGVWYEHDGRYDYAKYTKTDELKMALKFFNKLWNEGLMDKETFSQTPEMFIEKCVTGQIGVHGYSYVTTYTASGALMDGSGDTEYFVAMPPFSMNPDLPVEKVNSCEIITVPMNCVVVTKDGVSDEQMAAYARAIDFCGQYDANKFLNNGKEGVDWELVDGEMKLTDSFIEKRSTIENYTDVNGYGMFSVWNTNARVMAESLKCTVTQKDRKESCDNLAGHQVAISDAANAVIPGEIELEKQPLIENAWLQMVIKAVSAPDADSCEAAVEEWPAQLNALGYEDWVAERTAIINEAIGK